jgi:hypothetical protein
VALIYTNSMRVAEVDLEKGKNVSLSEVFAEY